MIIDVIVTNFCFQKGVFSFKREKKFLVNGTSIMCILRPCIPVSQDTKIQSYILEDT